MNTPLDKSFIVWSLPACKQHSFRVLPMLQIFSGGREPEVEGDGIRAVVVVGKQDMAIYLERWRRR